MKFINPFTPIIETKQYRYARSYRTGFVDKIMDAFYVFSGKLSNDTDDDVHGIFDYLTLGLHFLGTAKLIQLAETPKSAYSFTAWMALLIIFSIPRYVFATVMTFICLPIIGIVNVFTQKKYDEIEQTILGYLITDNTNQPSQFSTSAMTLGVLLKQKNWTLKDSEWSIPTIIDADSGHKHLEISLISHKKNEPSRTFTLSFNKADDKKLLQGLRELNINNLQTRIEKDEALDSICRSMN